MKAKIQSLKALKKSFRPIHNVYMEHKKQHVMILQILQGMQK